MTDRLILVTNDDGVDARGIKILTETMRNFGNVVVVAPNEGQSGKSQALTFNQPVKLRNEVNDPDFKVFRLWGTPVDCVKMAFDKVLPHRPDLVVSGINHGSNTSTSAIYSGTVSAAREACLNGIKAIAFSSLDFDTNADFSYTKPFIESIVKNVLDNDIDQGGFLNVNFPKESLEPINGIKICRNARGVWRERFVPYPQSASGDEYLLTGDFENYEPDADDTDEWALNHNWVSIVPLQTEATKFDSIDYLRTIYTF